VRRFLLPITLLFLGGALLLACPPDDDDTGSGDDDVADDDDADDDSADDDDSARPPLTEEQAYGKKYYGWFCSYCHGDDGAGYLADEAPALNNQTFLETATDPFLVAAIDHGRPGTVMSAWGWDYGGPLMPYDVSAMVAFFRWWQLGPSLDVHDQVIEGTPALATAVYAEHCAGCHGSDGGGEGIDGAGTALSNPWLLHTASDGFIKHAIVHGRPDTPMEPWAETLTEQQIDDIVALIRSWATPVEDTKVPPFEPDLSNPIVNEGGPPADFSDDLIDDLYVPLAAIWAAYDAGEAMVLLDSRPGSDYMTNHITGAVSTAFYRVDEAIAYMPDDLWLIAYCGCPHSLSGEVAAAMIEAGFATTGVLDEGYYAWLGANYPITTGTSQW
jgi:cytochrome c oxidase cbb3-type subunit III